MLSIAINTIVRIQAYKDFYANYDAEKDFQRMKVLSSLLILQFLTKIPLLLWCNIYYVKITNGLIQALGVFQSTALIAEKAEEEGGDDEE